MTLRRRIFFLFAGLLVVGLPGRVAAQVEINARSATVRVGGRIHSQFATSSAEGGRAADFFNRRARLTIDVQVSDRLDGRIQPDVSAGSASLKDAYFRVRLSPQVRVAFGQFKRAFDMFELDSSTEMTVVERTGRIDGLDACAGVGGVCSLSRFTEKLAYSDRDIGIRFDGSLGDRLSYLATVTNGSGSRGGDENDSKSFAGRLSLALTDQVTLSANASVHDYVAADEGTDRGTAFGGDLSVGSFRDGTSFKVGIVAGDNWKAADETTGESPTFVTGQAILSHYIPVTGDLFEAVEPMARVSWGDPNRDTVDDGGVLLTPGLFTYISGRNRIGLNLDVYAPQTGDTEYSLKVQTYLYF